MTSIAASVTVRSSLAPRPLRCRACGAERAAGPVSICEQCLGPLEPLYEPGRPLPDRETIAARAPSLWRYREWLPFDGEPVLSLDSGFTPLVEAPTLARRLGVARVWVKNDTVCHPSLSFKDRVVAAAMNAAAAFGLDTIGCAWAGNLANAVAAHAARAGLKAWIFVPETLEAPKVIGTSIYGPRLVRVRGTYDDVNRLCAQVADRFGWGMVNVNLRCYYGEGSKTVAYEIAEQLGWRLPSAVVAPMAGGSLLTKLRKGFAEFLTAGLVHGAAPRLYGAQAEGCAPIVRLVERGGARGAVRVGAVGGPGRGRGGGGGMGWGGDWDGPRARRGGRAGGGAGGGGGGAGADRAPWYAPSRHRAGRSRLAVRGLRGRVPRRRVQGAGRRRDRRHVRDSDRAWAGLVGSGDGRRSAGGAGAARPRARRRRAGPPVRRRRAPSRQRGAGDLRRRRARGPGARGTVDGRSARGARVARVRVRRPRLRGRDRAGPGGAPGQRVPPHRGHGGREGGGAGRRPGAGRRAAARGGAGRRAAPAAPPPAGARVRCRHRRGARRGRIRGHPLRLRLLDSRREPRGRGAGRGHGAGPRGGRARRVGGDIPHRAAPTPIPR